jgi:2-polyprenyl-3-methyl-5-hydroxy-6-metoxy-1,4-benzoquinol methylase
LEAAEQTHPPVPLFSERILATLKSPGADDSDSIELLEGALRSRISGCTYPFIEGVPSLFGGEGEGDDVRGRVQDFYEENPFPSYEGLEEFGELVNKGRHNPFTSKLLEAIGYNKLVLECGCGTGQLSHYLQLNNNHVLGIDMTRSSLALAIEHKRRNQLPRSSFAQMNIFDLAVKDESFDVVVSHGVLHHTYDARKAFSCVARKGKPGGIVMVGLYNSYARILTWLRSQLVSLTGSKIDYVVRNQIRDARKAEIWIRDQYFNPHETWHSIGEVLGWFEENDIEFLNCFPHILGSSGEDDPKLFGPSDPGTRYQRVVTQLSWLGTIAREGSLFDLIGRKRE